MPSYDVFLSYHRSDRKWVDDVRHLLNAHDVSTFVDYPDLIAGMPWPRALEHALDSVRAVAVFIGPEMGKWQEREMYYAIDRQARDAKDGRDFPVIPVLLPESDIRSGFLFLNTWVDLREDVTSAEAIGQLIKAIRGEAEPEFDGSKMQFSPYQGLKAFREQNAAFFFGREAFSQSLLEKVCSGKGLTAVIGPSGSGKSSIVHAGLLPLLRRQRPPAMTWDAVSFTPGEKPFHRLGAALLALLKPDMTVIDRLDEQVTFGDRLARGTTRIADVAEEIIKISKGTDRLLVIIDQFEELITLASKDSQNSAAASFVQAMMDALRDRAPVEFVLTLRADFYGRVIGLSRELSDRLGNSVLNVGPMTASELERAIVEPARKVGLGFEPGLVHRLLKDLEKEPGQLPLLEFTLWQLWDKRESRLMTHRAYEKFGGVAKAINSFAHTEFQKFTSEEQQWVRRIFTRLVRVVPSGEDDEDTSRRVFLKELGSVPRQIIDRLADARLLVTAGSEVKGEETVEVSHEALIREWSDLRSWLKEDREFLLWRQRLRVSLQEWQRIGHDQGALLRGALLDEAHRCRTSREMDLSEEERDFIGLSLEHRQKGVLEEARRRRKRMIAVTAGGVLVSVLAVLAGLLWQRAAEQQRIAIAGTLLSRASSIASNEPAKFDHAALLAIESLNFDPSSPAQPILRQAISLLPKQISGLQVDCEGEARLTVGGRFLTCLNNSNTSVRVLSVANGEDISPRRIEETTPISGVTASPDGKFVGIGFRTGGYKLIEAQTGELKAESRNPGTRDSDVAVTFSPTGNHFAAGLFDGSAFTVHVVIAQSGARLRTFPLKYRVLALAFSSDGRFLAALHEGTRATEVTIFDLSDGHSWRISGEAAFRVLALSPGANFIALLDIDNAVRVKEAGEDTEQEEVSKVTHTEETPTNAVAFSDDGRYTASGSDDGTARVIETSTGLPIALIPADSPVRSISFTSDNDLVIVSSDKMVRTFNVTKRPAFEALSGHSFIAISPRGRYLSTFQGSATSGLTILDRLSGQAVASLPLPRYVLSSGVIRYSFDEEYVVANGIAHGTSFLNITTGGTGHRKAISDLFAQAMSGDGKTIAWATAGKIMTFATEDTRDNSYRNELEFPNASVLELSPDGQFVAAAAGDPVLAVLNVATGNKMFEVKGTGRVKKATFSPDGRYLAVSMDDNLFLSEIQTQTVWQLGTLDSTLLVFSADGTMLATRAVSGGNSQPALNIKLIETATRTTLFEIQRQSPAIAVAFGPDGSYLDLIDDVSITRHYLQTSDLTLQTCQLLTRNFAEDEWQELETGASYRRTCPDLP